MNMHPAIKPAAWGALVGAIACVVVGFNSLGWALGSTAERQASERAQAAVVGTLTPIHVAKFRQQFNAATKLAEFTKVDSWDRGVLIEKGGWAGSDETATLTVASACAGKLGSPT
jgi:hypothetical protein